MRKKEKKTRKFTMRFTEVEFKKLADEFSNSTSSQLSQYARNVLLEKPVVIKYRNESLDSFMEELVLIRQELNAIGNNYNQAVKKLHTLRQIPEFRAWIDENEAKQQVLINKTNNIQQRIAQMSDKWLQG